MPRPPPERLAALAALLTLAVGAPLGGCGGQDDRAEREAAPRPSAKPLVVGEGARSATIIPPASGARPSGVTVAFLHGWGATAPENYGPWIAHLAARGHTIVYPRYQDSVLTPPPETLGNAIAGLRAALERTGPPRALVAVGHSAGGALAADLAASAGRAGLPPVRAVLSLYPGRALRGIPARIPPQDLARIPARTPVVALAGADDVVVGSGFARAIARSATRARARYVLVRDRRVDDHLGPQRAGAASRQVFWRRLDGLIGSIPPQVP